MAYSAIERVGIVTAICHSSPAIFHVVLFVPPPFQVVPGELTVVTGVPNSGKSEWIDALLCNINKECGWKFVLCSMENKASHC